ncbi:MAG: hypothetical protein KDA22_11565, partial [Phycisphaerales bacterium]|nr:hypothetical protein [Phycisphaerales bacterium]
MLLALERAQNRPIFGRRIRVDVYDASGAKLDFGAITSALEFEYSLKLDEIGAFRMALPADDVAVGELDQGYELRCYRGGEGLVFRGLIDAIAWGEDGSRRVAEVTGSSIARKLVFANTLLGLAFEGDSLADVVSTLLTGTGWSAGSLDS